MEAGGDYRQTLGEPRALISRSALLHNAAIVRRALPHGTKICAVVKADAYGHGADIVVDTLCNFSHTPNPLRTVSTGPTIEPPAVDALAVASIDEAANLPAIDIPTFILRPVENTYVGRQRAKLEHAIRNNWTLTLCSPAGAQDVARIALAINHRASVQIMVDTGLTRSGVDHDKTAELAAVIRNLASLKLTSACSHFACSDDPSNPFNTEQLRRFRAAASDPLAAAHPKLFRHMANSAALFAPPPAAGASAHFDMVRPGISLYGIDPTGKPSMDRVLRPVMKWIAPLLLIHDIPKGGSVGYAQSWTAPRDSRIGLVPVGYADGYFRSLGNKSAVMIHHRAVPVVGRVSMDYITIDLTGIPQAAIGDEITLLDNDPLSPASVYALAHAAGTIPYELFCRVGQRVQRVAVDPVESPTEPTPTTSFDA